VVTAAIIGVSIGYWIGKRYGRPLFKNDKSWVFSKKHLNDAEDFYNKYGGRAIVLARFLPVVRTFAPIVAGIAHMDYRRFMMFNVLGALLWAFGLTVLGYALGNVIPPEIMEKYLLLIILTIIVLSFLPTAIHILNDKRKNNKV
jgi:membrane-associated protein